MAVVNILIQGANRTAAAFAAANAGMRRLANNARVLNNRVQNNLIGRGGITGILNRQFTRMAANYQQGMNRVNRMLEPMTEAMGNMSGKQWAIAFGVAASPLIAAAIDSAILLGVGGGTLAAGVALAFKNDTALSDVFQHIFIGIAKDAKNFSTVFTAPLLRSAHLVQDAWSEAVGPGLMKAFDSLAKHVEPLIHGLTDMASNAMPGFNKAVEASGPLLDKLASLLPEIGDAVSSFFDSVSDGKDGAMKALVLIVALLSQSLRALGNTIEFLSKTFDVGTDWAESYGKKLGELWPPARKVGEVIGEMNAEARRSSEIFNLVEDAVDGTGYASKRAAQAAVALDTAMDALLTTMTTSLDSEIAYQQAIDDLAESFKENGKSIDLNTQKGRDNVRAVEDVARAAYASREAAIAAAQGQADQAQATDAANLKFHQQIEALRKQLMQLGLTKAQADALLQSWYGLADAPNITKSFTVERKLLGPSLGGAFGYRGFARGTPSAPPGWAWTGEHGPELIKFRGGEQVKTSRSSAQMAGRAARERGAGNGDGASFDVTFGAAPGGMDWFGQLVLTAIRTNKLNMYVGGKRVTASA